MVPGFRIICGDDSISKTAERLERGTSGASPYRVSFLEEFSRREFIGGLF